MAVGGLHQAESDHGRLVTAMGVEMVQKAKNVTIPRKKENIQVRICCFLAQWTLLNDQENTCQTINKLPKQLMHSVDKTNCICCHYYIIDL